MRLAHVVVIEVSTLFCFGIHFTHGAFLAQRPTTITPYKSSLSTFFRNNNIRSDLCAVSPSSSSFSVTTNDDSLLRFEKTDASSSPNTLKEKNSSYGSSSIEFIRPLYEMGYPPVVCDQDHDEDTSSTTKKKPLLLYLPGFDGTWISPFLQFPELSTIYDIHCLTMKMDDRSTLDDLIKQVIEYIKTELNDDDDENVTTKESRTTNETKMTEKPVNGASSSKKGGNNGTGGPLPFWLSRGDGGKKKKDKKKVSSSKQQKRQVYLVGESFGAILASLVINTWNKDNNINNDDTDIISGLVMINPATCYDRSKLARIGPELASLEHGGNWFYTLSIIQKFLPLFKDEYSMESLMLILQSKYLPSVIDTPAREAYTGRVAFSLPFILKFMPQDTLQWRLTEWLEKGCNRIHKELPSSSLSMSISSNDFMHATTTKTDKDDGSNNNRAGGGWNSFPTTLLVVGDDDRLLPSLAEAERLSHLLPSSKTTIHVVEGAGHGSTCGSRVDLAALCRQTFSKQLKLDKRKRKRRRRGGKQKKGDKQDDDDIDRMEMKPEAAQNTGVLFGLTKRYNGEEKGLSPLKYWSRTLYQKPSRNS